MNKRMIRRKEHTTDEKYKIQDKERGKSKDEEYLRKWGGRERGIYG